MRSASLTTGRRTAIGSAILESIDAIAEIDTSRREEPRPRLAPGEPPEPVPDGAYVPHIVVVLTDGRSNTGPEPVEAAQQAVDRGVRVYTIGFGTADPGEFLPRCGAERRERTRSAASSARASAVVGGGGAAVPARHRRGDPQGRRRDDRRRVLLGRERGRAPGGVRGACPRT